MTLVSYLVGYVLDFFRERVTAADFGGEPIERVVVASGMDNESLAVVRGMFAGAEVRVVGPHPASPLSAVAKAMADEPVDGEEERPSPLTPLPEGEGLSAGLWAIRRLRPDVVCIPMTGGGIRERLALMMSGARHKLLVPSSDYIYRFGMRRGALRWCWAVIDHFALAPFVLAWFGLVAVWMWASGLIGQSVAAERRTPWRPRRVVAIRLMPTRVFVSLLRRIARDNPGVHLAAVLASEDGREEVAEAADEVVVSAGWRGLRLAVPGPFDAVILAGGADYWMGRTYLKGLLTVSAFRADARYQWEVGDALPGLTIGEAAARARRMARERETPPLPVIGRWLLQRRYARQPSRGPTMVQIGLTKACNYHCLFCPFHNPQVDERHREAEQPRMSYEMLACLLGELKRMGTRAVDICGDGEPLTHPEALEMIALARDLGFEVTLATNAALLTEERARRLVELGVRRMHVSFNAATDDVYERLHPGAPPGTRARIIERLRAMAEYAETEGYRPIDVEFSAVLNRLNMRQIPQMVEAAREARAGWFMLILMGPAEGAETLLPRAEDWAAIRDDIERAAGLAQEYGIRTNLAAIRPGASEVGTGSIYERIACYIGHEYALITADGGVMFCCQCSRPLGNLRQESFRQIWYSESYRRAREQAMCLPRKARAGGRGEALEGCECLTACSHVAVNLEVYRTLHGERLTI
ncbi:MAG: radical SAM/SPASM domain-containing protein [Armatimonadota bacterium]